MLAEKVTNGQVICYFNLDDLAMLIAARLGSEIDNTKRLIVEGFDFQSILGSHYRLFTGKTVE